MRVVQQATRRTVGWTAALSIVCLWACSTHSIDREQLSSHFRAIASSAAESELLIDKLLGGKVTATYARSYIPYLLDTARSAAGEIQKNGAVPSLESSLAKCRRLNQVLLEELERLKDAVGNPSALNRAKSRFDQIRAESKSDRERL